MTKRPGRVRERQLVRAVGEGLVILDQRIAVGVVVDVRRPVLKDRDLRHLPDLPRIRRHRQERASRKARSGAVVGQDHEGRFRVAVVGEPRHPRGDAKPLELREQFGRCQESKEAQ